MARLTIFQDGNKLCEADLSLKTEWIVGRGAEADIVLENDKGISRQHLKIRSENGKWIVDVLSKYGELYQKGKKAQAIRLENGSRFEVPPFEFLFETVTESQSTMTPSNGTAATQSADPLMPALVREDSLPVVDESFSSRTMVGISRVVPFLKACNHERKVVQTFRLEGHVWTAGRETSCAIFIDNQKFSRRQFEIRLEEHSYLIRDLGSSNGTMLNGQRLPNDKWMPIHSGDVIGVVDWCLYFELRDAEFQGKLQQVAQEFLPAQSYTLDLSAGPVASLPGLSGAVSSNHKKRKSGTNWVRLMIYLIALGGGGFYLFTDNQPAPPPKEAVKQLAGPLDKLKPQQQQYVKDTYRLADRLFKEGRYEMARQEVAKIHELVPFYEESKNLEKLAEVAIQTQIEQQKAEMREREKIEMEEKIQAAVVVCEKQINGQIEMRELDDCLSNVMALNPEHPLIMQLKARVDQIITERTVRIQKQAEYQALVRKQKLIFEKASGVVAKGNPLEAIEALNTVVASKLPDPNNYRGEAKRQIASIQKKMSDQQAEIEKEADGAYKKGDLKGAVLVLKKALDINPENENVRGRITSIIAELKKQMQVFYQEGILEESVGEVETAKTKWKKIIETSVPEEDYYKKAKSKLKKYGIE
jgi:pSer/pThr/pTyr-binding forkhead associated (FHA) protein